MPGKVYGFEAYKYILDFDTEAAQDAFILIAHSEPKGWLSWVYDKNSLEPIESICTSLQASRIQMYVRMLGAMNATQAVPVWKNWQSLHMQTLFVGKRSKASHLLILNLL